MSKRQLKSITKKAILSISLFCLVAILSAVFFSSIGAHSSASATDSTLNVTLDPVLSIRVVKNNADISDLTLSIDPTPTGRFVKDDLNVLVSTSNSTGYTLSFANNDTDTAMHHTDNAVTTTIPSIATSTDESGFPVNSWGYSLSNATNATTFLPIPTSTSTATIKTTSTQGAEDSTDLTFAAKADTSITAGTYQDTVVFTATTNYVPQSPLAQISNMQDMTIDICNQSTIGDEATLTDARDGNTYVVRKLADGKCWMVQNLRLGGSSAITLTPQDSNVTANFTLSATTNSFGTTNDAAGININRMHDNGNTWLNGSSVQTSGTPPSQTQYMGNYYNWYTATAGSGTYSTGANVIATQSICPKGWRLPTGGAINITTGNGEFRQLFDAYGNTTNFISNTSAVLSGYWNDSSADSQGISGGWWSSTAESSMNGYFFHFISSTVVSQGNNYKRHGRSVRCVADDTDLSKISNMQDMYPTVCENSKIGDEKILKDTRDNKTYTIKKLADGKCWMVQNLRLGGSSAITLTPVDSNVTANFTLSATTNSFGTTSDAAGININRMHDNGNTWIDSSNTVQTSGAPPSQTQYIGNYYNWYTATAGSGTYSTGSNVIATQSICPKGWRLPTGGAINATTGNGEFRQLYDAYGNATNFISNTSAVPSGFWSNSSALSQGSNGIWWSSTAYDSASGYSLSFNSSSVLPQVINSKRYGLSMRCIAE